MSTAVGRVSVLYCPGCPDNSLMSSDLACLFLAMSESLAKNEHQNSFKSCHSIPAKGERSSIIEIRQFSFYSHPEKLLDPWQTKMAGLSMSLLARKPKFPSYHQSEKFS